MVRVNAVGMYLEKEQIVLESPDFDEGIASAGHEVGVHVSESLDRAHVSVCEKIRVL